MSCGWLFVSPDRVRIGRCADCKKSDGGYSPRTGNTQRVYEAARAHHTRDTS